MNLGKREENKQEQRKWIVEMKDKENDEESESWWKSGENKRKSLRNRKKER